MTQEFTAEETSKLLAAAITRLANADAYEKPYIIDEIKIYQEMLGQPSGNTKYIQEQETARQTTSLKASEAARSASEAAALARTQLSEGSATGRTAMTIAGENQRSANALTESSRHNQATELAQSFTDMIASGKLSLDVAQQKFLQALDLRNQFLKEQESATTQFSNLAPYSVPSGVTQYPGTEQGGVINRVTGLNPGSFGINAQPYNASEAVASNPNPMPQPNTPDLNALMAQIAQQVGPR